MKWVVAPYWYCGGVMILRGGGGGGCDGDIVCFKLYCVVISLVGSSLVWSD